MAVVCVAFWDQLSEIFTVVEPPQGQGAVVLSLGDYACCLTRHTEFVSIVDPFDPEKPAVTSGIRLGSPAATTRGFGAAEFRAVGLMINEVLDGLSRSNDGSNEAAEIAVGARVQALCARFPLYRAS